MEQTYQQNLANKLPYVFPLLLIASFDGIYQFSHVYLFQFLLILSPNDAYCALEQRNSTVMQLFARIPEIFLAILCLCIIIIVLAEKF